VRNSGTQPGANTWTTWWTTRCAMASVRSPTSIVSSRLVTGSRGPAPPRPPAPSLIRPAPRGDVVEGPPHPMRRARQALDRLSLADLTVLDRADQGKEFVQLDLRDAQMVQEIEM